MIDKGELQRAGVDADFVSQLNDDDVFQRVFQTLRTLPAHALAGELASILVQVDREHAINAANRLVEVVAVLEKKFHTTQ